MVRTTPFTCGAQASVTIITRSCRRPAGSAAAALSGVNSSGWDGQSFCGFWNESRGMLCLRRCPVENLQMSASIFREGCAAFNPVAVVGVEDTVDGFDRRVMNMTAHDAVEASRARFIDNGSLETANEFDRILH